MIRLALCDDDPVYKALLEGCLSRYKFKTAAQDLVNFELCYFSTAQAMMEASWDFDVLFLDITLENGRDGIEEAKRLRLRGVHVPIILLTAATDRYKDGYEANIFRYMLKPLTDKGVHEALDAVLDYMCRTMQTIEIKYCGYSDLVRLDTIVLLETYYRKRYIYLPEQTLQTVEPWGTLKMRLPPSRFYTVNRSYIVNLSHVRTLSKAEITMSNGMLIKFPRLNKEMFEDFSLRLKAFLSS